MKKMIKVIIGLLAVVGLFFLLFKSCTAMLQKVIRAVFYKIIFSVKQYKRML